MSVMLRFRVIGAGFAVGALMHCIEASSQVLASWRPDYPLWRHALFVAIDGGLAVLAVVAPKRLWFSLAVLLIQQSSTHGRDVWMTWQSERRIAWLDALVV